jgi:transcriptional regulator with XRE-family HTH domain
MKKDKKDSSLPALCVIVREIRRAYGESQPSFAQRVRLAPQTISRFERGVQVPADSEVLIRLAQAARAKNLTDQAAELERVASQASSHIEELREARGPGTGLWAMPIFSLRQWRLMHIAGIAALYFPETVRAIEQAYEQHTAEAVAWVDDAIRQYAEEPLASGLGYHGQLSQTLMNLAGQRAIEKYKPKGKS